MSFFKCRLSPLSNALGSGLLSAFELLDIDNVIIEFIRLGVYLGALELDNCQCLTKVNTT